MIKTYLEFINESILDLESYLSKNLSKEFYWFSENSKLNINVTKSNYLKVLSIINTLDKKYNYYIASAKMGLDDDEIDFNYFRKYIRYNLIEIIKGLDSDTNNEESIILLKFEPRYGNKMEVPDIIYHITDRNKYKIIKKRGLLPKNINRIAYHPKRIYLLKNKEDAEQLLSNKKFTIDNPMLLTIDVSKIKTSMNFYVDINYPNGFFTDSKISPKYIINVEKLEK